MTATSQEISTPDDTVTNHPSDTGRWLKLHADIEHEPQPIPFEEHARQKRVYETGGFGGPYSAPSGSLEP